MINVLCKKEMCLDNQDNKKYVYLRLEGRKLSDMFSELFSCPENIFYFLRYMNVYWCITMTLTM